MSYLTSLGFLRLLLIGLAILCILLRPEPGTAAVKEGFEIVPTLISPASAPILVMVILFDALMSKVRASDSEGEEQVKFKKILRVELATVAIMLIAWTPYFSALGQ